MKRVKLFEKFTQDINESVNEKRKDNVTYGKLDPKKHTEENPLVLTSHTNKNLYKAVRVFAKSIAKIYGWNLTSAISMIKEELNKLNDKEG